MILLFLLLLGGSFTSFFMTVVLAVPPLIVKNGHVHLFGHVRLIVRIRYFGITRTNVCLCITLRPRKVRWSEFDKTSVSRIANSSLCITAVILDPTRSMVAY